ncbi:MAG: hypothetical protein C4522_11555 [Desulfobacteraceae bacterium]|nr:MAG: hypothetical protein C4522_11555 [Desulfobacteraceae bacterium]
MVKKQYLFMAAAVLCMGAFAVYHVYFDEKAKVKKQFALFGRRISKQAEESRLIEAASINKALHLFSRQVRLEIPSRSISRTYDRRDLSAPLFSQRSRYAKIDLQFLDYIIGFPGEDKAQVNVTMNLKAQGMDGSHMDETHELICDLVKNERDDWIFSRVEIVEVLEK